MTVQNSDADTIEAIATLITRHIDRQQDSLKRRDQHPKQHGCLMARFCVEPHLWEKLPEACRVGLFSQPHTFPAWVRFSTLREQDDTKGDIHGMAIKVVVEENSDGSESERQTKIQDFVFIDAPRFFIKGVRPYLELFQLLDLVAALKDPSITDPPATNKLVLRLKILMGLLAFLIPSPYPQQWRFREVWILVSARLQKRLFRMSSPLDQSYWSTTPYRLGSAAQAVKYVVRPSAINKASKPKRYTPNYLREALIEHLTHHQQQARFDFYIQVKENPTLTDLDDSTIEWKDVPEYKVATLQIPPQQFYAELEPVFGEDFSFTPWHCLPEHEPLGSMNTIRQRVYFQAAGYRNNLNQAAGLPSPKSPKELPRKLPVGQTPLTVICPLRPNALNALEAELENVSQQIEDRRETYFAKSPATHFARWVILDAPEQNVAPHLLFTSNHDGPVTDYLQELVETMGAEMDAIWCHCEGFNPGDALDVETFAQFVQRYSLKTQAFYVGCRDVTAREILAAKTLRQRVDRLAQTHAAALEAPLKELSALTPRRSPEPPFPSLLLSSIGLFKALASGLQAWVGIFPKRNNPGDRFPPQPSQVARMQACTQVEDRLVANGILPNQMTTLSPIKSEFHKLILKTVLWLVNQTAKTSRGTLVGISTIHFARWVIVDKGILNDTRTSYLIFESNYRGSWDSYLDDFVYKTLIPMNLIWGNLEGFPSNGCQDIEMFKQHQRPRQFPAQVYYCAYPELSVQNILCDRALATAIRDLKDYLSGAYSLLSAVQDPLLMRLVKSIGQ
ncbi:hypothetical protein [Altericista sp. CCNU0014]|uniref:hypothetical protein n=1 Tax=Altericista sp. CCNU0014 TaxID=3082949 RepID=UPI00384CCEC5